MGSCIGDLCSLHDLRFEVHSCQACHPHPGVSHPMLIMLLLVLSISSVQYVMNLLVDVFNALDEANFFVNFSLDMS